MTNLRRPMKDRPSVIDSRCQNKKGCSCSPFCRVNTRPSVAVAVSKVPVEHHHIHPVAGFDMALFVVQHDQTVGLHHRVEYA